ncbi:MAG: hypothetical protein EOP46_05070 [Sphingobacteriaceae bacterium]|nr:MAG: hypothetical protein EOP46_05070 [Sphingobacteriaceae bacterium]
MIIAELEYTNSHSSATGVTDVKVFIVMKDTATDRPVSVVRRLVNYTQTINSVTTYKSIYISGQRASIYQGRRYGPGFNASWAITERPVIGDDDDIPIPPQLNKCDLRISGVSVMQQESAPGAGDGRISVTAQSSYAIEYSINGTTWQTSPVFGGLAGGYYAVLVRDSNPRGCTDETYVTIPTIRSLLIADPSVNIGGSNISRWSAAFNPIVFTYQRRDFEVVSIDKVNVATKGYCARLKINGTVSSVKPEELIYVDAVAYKGVYKVLSSTSNTLTIDTPFTTSHAGFVNINSLRPYYKVQTKITSIHPETGVQQSMLSVNRPDTTGLIKADVSHFLQSLLMVKDDSDYAQLNYRDAGLSASYTIAFSVNWDGNIDNDKYIPVADPFYVLFAAKQLGDKHGGNMAEYVPFKTVAQPAQRAKWLTDFQEPAYSNNYPFDIGFIYSEHLLGLQLYAEVVMLDINRQPLPGGLQNTYLLNEDGSWLLNQDGSKLLIIRQTMGNLQLPEKLGLNRLLIDYDFPDDACYFTIAIKYNDGNNTAHTITQTQTIRIDKAVDDNSVYLRWIGLNGAWNYYRFVYNQEVSLDIQNTVIIKNHVTDWENQQGIEEVISKNAGQKVKVIAEDLSVNDIKGLQSVKYSPKVQLLVNKSPVKWQTVVVNSATFSEYETRNGQAPFSITFNLPAINVQSQ